MAYIREVPENEADVNLRSTYTQIRETVGFLPHFWQAQGARPEIAQAHWDLWRAIYRAGVLPAVLKEEIGLVVSAVNSDSYCILMHLELLHRLGVEKSLGRQLVHDYEAADVPEREKALFRYAKKLTREPFTIKETDVVELRPHGWVDAAILEACVVAGHFNFLNRLAAGLGLVPEHVF